MSGKRLTGRIPPDRIGAITLSPIPEDLLAAFRSIEDLTSAVSDALDRLGLVGAVPASTLAPLVPGARIVGRALTVENRRRPTPAPAGESGLADIEAHNLAEAGDVLVVRGVAEVSSMGGISGRIGKRQGELGAIVDGAVRDADALGAIGYPVWSRGLSPLTGKSRLETVGINRPVEIAGITVLPGDLVLADRVGVVFVPVARASDVLAAVQAGATAERAKRAAIDAGVPIPDLPGVARD